QLIVPEKVSIERLVTMTLIDAAVKFAAATASSEFDLDSTFRVTLGARCRSRNTDFLDRVRLWLNQREETVRAFQHVVLNIKTVKSDVEHGLRQAVNGGLSWSTGGCRTRQKQQQVERIT